MDNEVSYVQPQYNEERIDSRQHGFQFVHPGFGGYHSNGFAGPFLGGILGGLVGSAIFPHYGYGYGNPYPYPYYGYGYPVYPYY